MRKVYILLGIALLGVLALSNAATSSAFEILCLNDTGSLNLPRYLTEAECLAMTPVNETGTWYLGFEWLVNSVAVPAGGLTVDATTTKLLLEDMQAGPLKQATDVECEGTGIGLLLPGGLDEQNSANPVNCKRGASTGACTELLTVAPVNLPWLTELFPISETEAEDALYEGTGGNPGWAVTCLNALGGTSTDTCTTNKGTTLLTQEGEEIDSEFMESAPLANAAECTEGSPKAEAGLTNGLVLLHALVNEVLAPLTIS
jgi:hypothetical protein